MAGHQESAEKLNRTLIKIIQLLQAANITQWFIAYGTLLGIHRQNSCIENDDDIDIVMDVRCKPALIELLAKNGFKLSHNGSIVKTIASEDFASIDFYMAEVNEATGDYHDTWENVVWSECTPLIAKEWNESTLFMPQNTETKLRRRYGDDFMTPKQSKGPHPPLKKI